MRSREASRLALQMMAVLVGCSVFSVFSGCEQEVPYIDRVFNGQQHPLYRSLEWSDQVTRYHKSARGVMFTYTETADGSSMKQVNVTFAWLSDSCYVISTLPLEKIRIRFSSKEAPSVRFHLARIYGASEYGEWNETQSIMQHCVNWAELTIRKEDWPSRIEVPFNPRSFRTQTARPTAVRPQDE